MPDESGIEHRVISTGTALKAMREQMHYIAIKQHAPQQAKLWLDRVWTCINSLKFMPRRFPAANGYDHVGYVVRRIVLDNHLILFTIDDVNARVYVVGLRHAARWSKSTDVSGFPHADAAE